MRIARRLLLVGVAAFILMPQAIGTAAQAAAPMSLSSSDVCGPVRAHQARCLAKVLLGNGVRVRPGVVSPSAGPAGLRPADIQSAYGLPGGSAGAGVTVGVIDAYDNPNAE